MDPERTVRQLSGRDVRIVWGKLSHGDRQALLPRFTTATVAEYDLRVDPDAGGAGEPQSSLHRFDQLLRQLVLDGRIDGDDLWETILDNPACVPLESGPPERVRLVVLQPVLPEHSCLRLLIAQEEYEGKACFLKLVRYEGGNRQVVENAALPFDSQGMASWSSPPISIAGLYEILVEDGSGESLAMGWVAVARGCKEGLGLVAETTVWERVDEHLLRVRVQGQLVNAWGPARFDATLHARLRCACGEV